MKKIFIGLLVCIFFGIIGGAGIYYIRYRVVEPEMNNWETETNLPLIGRNTSYDVMFLGTSHARVFSRFHNHERTEKIIGKSLINLSQGAEKGGVWSQHIYLSYFFFRRNAVKTIVYFVDPFFFFRKKEDENPKLFENEPYRSDFLRIIRDEGATPQQIAYFQKNGPTPFSPPEFDLYFKEEQRDAMKDVTQDQISGRAQFLYQDPYDEQSFKRLFDEFINTIRLAQSHGVTVHVVIPTTLIPEQAEDHYVYAALQEASNKYHFSVTDLAHAIEDPSLYYDVDHLNTKGVETFARTYLKPLLEKP